MLKNLGYSYLHILTWTTHTHTNSETASDKQEEEEHEEQDNVKPIHQGQRTTGKEEDLETYAEAEGDDDVRAWGPDDMYVQGFEYAPDDLQVGDVHLCMYFCVCMCVSVCT